MAEIDEDVDLDISVHDFDLECECNNHPESGQGPVVATVDYKLPCCGLEYSTFICVGCVARILRRQTEDHVGGKHLNRQPVCGGHWAPWHASVVRITYL